MPDRGAVVRGPAAVDRIVGADARTEGADARTEGAEARTEGAEARTAGADALVLPLGRATAVDAEPAAEAGARRSPPAKAALASARLPAMATVARNNVGFMDTLLEYCSSNRPASARLRKDGEKRVAVRGSADACHRRRSGRVPFP
jgi:hypothetical protein